MTRNLFIMNSLLAILCIISCTRTNDNNPAPDPTDNKPKDTLSTKIKDTLLSKIVIWDSADLKNIFTREFIFDDQKRVKLIVSYYSDTNGIKLSSAKTDTSFQCFYNGNDKNAYRAKGWNLFTMSSSSEVFHLYNSNNQIIKDSIYYGSQGQYGSREYFYAADKLTTYDTHIASPLPTSHSRDTFLITNYNITQARFSFAPGISGWDLFDLTYDNKINPLNKLNIAPLRIIEGEDAFDKLPNLSPGFSKNNMTQRISRYKDPRLTSTATYNFQYTYNENDLPVYCKQTSTTYPTSYTRLKYLYTH